MARHRHNKNLDKHLLLVHKGILLSKSNSINIPDMKNKSSRLNVIKMLISSSEIGSQEELLGILRNHGFNLTQATLSRDLKQLKVAKAATPNGSYIYVLPNDAMYRRVSHDIVITPNMPINNGYKSIDFSGNMAIIKTRSGYAGGISYEIDKANFDEILGTIAGDDTILLVLREGTSRQKLKELLVKIIPNL